MRLSRVEVEHFGCIRRAVVEFGPGLNVLFGPNDLGKSTLARSIRAALLLPHTSSAAQDFVEWDSDENPRVKLTLELPDRRTWRIEKRFGSSGGSSILRESTDGQTFSPYKKAREVDEELRTMLGWGIASPASKGAPRGLPTSFLAQVLLGEQADVAGVLQATIDEHDTDPSGRERLTGALAAFAQDPLFKSILNVAQGEVARAFTAKGNRRRGQTSPFREVGDEVKRVTEELERLARRVAESENARRELAECNAELLKQQEVRLEATEKRSLLFEAKAQRDARRVVEEDLRIACERLEEERAEVAALREKEELLARTRAEVEEAKKAHESLIGQRDDLAALGRCAEETLRRAKSAEAEQARQLRRGELEKRLLKLDSSLEKLVAERASATKARALHAELAKARERRAELESQREMNERVAEDVAERKLQGEHQLELVDVAGRLQEKRRLASSIEECERIGADITADRATASEHAARARTLLNGIPADLPGAAGIAGMKQLAHELEVAEAKLGGGLAVVVERLQSVAIVGTADGSELDAPPGGRVSFEATRGFALQIGDVARISVRAGEKEVREQEAALRERWKTEVAPQLEAFGVADLDSLVARVEQAEGVRREAGESEAAASSLRERAAMREEQLAKLPALRQELEAVERELVGKPVERAAEMLDALGDTSLADHRIELKRRLSIAQERLECARRALSEASTEASLVAERLERTQSDIAELGMEAPASGLDEVEAGFCKREADLVSEKESITVELDTTVKEQGTEIETAEAELARLQAALETSGAQLTESASELDALRENASRLDGEIENRRAAVAKLDVDTASRTVEEITARLAELPVPMHDVTEEALMQAERDVEEAQHAYDRANDAVRKAEGALQTVGGQVVLEEQTAAKDALRLAERKEHEVELEYDAWKLLVDKLREAENTEGQHLGEALGQPISERFAALTRDRYGKLEVAPNLKAEGLRVAGVLRDVHALSVGTQEQLATLLRLAVAEHIQTTLVLDDHLTQTDPERGAWFRDVLRNHASTTQVIVLTCRPEDYLGLEDLPVEGEVMTARAGGLVRATNLSKVLERGGDTTVGTREVQPVG
ncbi:MAG: hypothetical protein CMP06_14550 [Xanthomonadales bacterium]|nr:hypothetical protein [Xanthomonadales bacterium]